MRVSLTEIFGLEDPQYLMGIAFETLSYDENKNMKVKQKGWELPYEAADLYEIDAYATKYQIPGRIKGNSLKFWESEEPFKDGMTGDETYYIMYVKNMDGSDIGLDEFHNINEKLNDESEENWTFKSPRRPLI